MKNVIRDIRTCRKPHGPFRRRRTTSDAKHRVAKPSFDLKYSINRLPSPDTHTQRRRPFH